MDWYRADANLKAHWKLSLLCHKLKIEIRDGVGLLHLFWEYVCNYADSGDLTNKNLIAMASYLNWPIDKAELLLETLIETGFIDRTENGIVVHNWHSRNRRVFDNRDYQKTYREKQRSLVVGDKGTRTSNTRKKIAMDHHLVNKSFDRFWEAFGTKAKRAKCLLRWKALMKKDGQTLAEKIIKAAQEYNGRFKKSGREKNFKLLPLSWLNGECWDDDLDDIFGKSEEDFDDERKKNWDKMVADKKSRSKKG